MRHPGLALWNIVIDPDDLKITSILDWQGASVLPYPIQAGYPWFLSNDRKGVSEVRQLDKLPDNFDSLDKDEKVKLQVNHIDRLSCQLYILANAKYNRAHFNALQQMVNPCRAELVSRAGRPWNGDIVAFRRAILDVILHWELFAKEPCPLDYPLTNAKRWIEESEEWLEAEDSLRLFRDDLGINEDGWIATDEYNETAERNRYLRWEITKGAEPPLRKEMWKVWPFKDESDMSEWTE
jgi:hypothetical protein